MSDERKNIKLPEPLFDRLKADKPDHMKWPAYLEQQCLSDSDVTEATEAAKQAESNTEEIKRQLEAIQGAMV